MLLVYYQHGVYTYVICKSSQTYHMNLFCLIAFLKMPLQLIFINSAMISWKMHIQQTN